MGGPNCSVKIKFSPALTLVKKEGKLTAWKTSRKNKGVGTHLSKKKERGGGQKGTTMAAKARNAAPGTGKIGHNCRQGGKRASMSLGSKKKKTITQKKLGARREKRPRWIREKKYPHLRHKAGVGTHGEKFGKKEGGGGGVGGGLVLEEELGEGKRGRSSSAPTLLRSLTRGGERIDEKKSVVSILRL